MSLSNTSSLSMGAPLNPAQPDAQARPGRFLILILGLLTALGPLTIDMYLPAFQAIAQSLQSPTVLVQQTLSIYFMGMALGQLIYGPLSDRFGRKGPLMIGLALYAVSSLACAMAPNIYTLIGFRLFQALGGCAGVVVSRAVTRDYFSPREMARVMSLLMLVMGLAPVLAPTAGGFLVRYLPLALGWRAVFAVLTLLGLSAMAMVWFSLPESLPVAERLQKLEAREIFSSYWHILQDRLFLWPTLAGGLCLGALFTYVSASSVVFLEFFKVAPFAYSLLFAFNAIGLIGGAQINRFLLKYSSPERVMSRALTLSVLFCLIFNVILMIWPAQLWSTALCLWGVLAALGFVMPNSAAVAMAHLRGHVGSASAMMGVIQYALGAMCSALVAALLSQYGGQPIVLTAMMFVTLFLARLVYRVPTVSAETSAEAANA